MPVHPTSAEFEQMFELAPVSLWLEDYSALKVLFAQWRAEGVTDLLAHVAGQPQRLQQCTAAIKVLRVNRRTLELFAASRNWCPGCPRYSATTCMTRWRLS